MSTYLQVDIYNNKCSNIVLSIMDVLTKTLQQMNHNNVLQGIRHHFKYAEIMFIKYIFNLTNYIIEHIIIARTHRRHITVFGLISIQYT